LLSGQMVRIGEVQVEAMWPSAVATEVRAEARNDMGPVVRVTVRGHRIRFTGGLGE